MPYVAKIKRDDPFRLADKREIEAMVNCGLARGRRLPAVSHRSCHLLFKATRGVTIALVSSRERKRRQPGLATNGPEFVGWRQLVRGIQGS
jgi:hypothetical protein